MIKPKGGKSMSNANPMSSILLALITIFSTIFSAPQETNSEPLQCKAILFDLGGVVIETSKSRVFREIGIWPLLNFWCHSNSYKDFSKLRTRLYELLDAVAQKEGNPWGAQDDENKPMPFLMTEWLRGSRPNKEIRDEIYQWIKDNPEWFAHTAEKKVLKKIVKTIFDPKTFMRTRVLIPETVALIKECKKRGFKLYVLSNWDSETGKLLVEQHSDLFEQFDGIVFSGDVHHMKPEKEIFECISETIPADQCVFIDDQEVNIDAAKKLDFKTILVKKQKSRFGLGSSPDIDSVREELGKIEPIKVTQEMYAYA